MGAIWIIVLRELRIYFRDKSHLISSIFRPLLWLVFIGFGVGASVKFGKGVTYAQFVLPGIIGMSILFTSIFFGMSVIWDRQFGFLKVILVAPIKRSSIVVAKMISGSIISTFQGSIVLCVSPLLKVYPTFWQVIGVVLLMFICSMALTALGILIAARMESFEGFNLIMNFILMPMFFFSGALFPIKGVPAFLEWLVKANPMTYCVDALRYVMLDMHSFTLFTDAAVITGFMILAWQLAALSFKRV